MKTRTTITFQPAKDVKSLLGKAIRRCPRQDRRGVRSRFINEAVRVYFAGLRGKREDRA